MLNNERYSSFYRPEPIPEVFSRLFEQNPDHPLVGTKIFETASETNHIYTIGYPIGGGGFSNVYHGFDHTTGELVTIKIAKVKENDPFSPHTLLPTEAMIGSFESRHNPYVPVVKGCKYLTYGPFEHSPTTAVIFEFFDPAHYKNLQEHLNQKTLDAQDLASIISQSANAIDLMHGRSDDSEVHLEGLLPHEPILHIDIKLGNVLYNKGAKNLKIIDFGVSAMNEIIKNEEIVLGTIPYITPEAIEGNKPDFRRDLWAHAVVAFELITGQKPFGLDKAASMRDEMELIYKNDGLSMDDEDLLLEALYNLGVYDNESQNMILRQFHKAFLREPAIRFQTASEFGNPLVKILDPNIKH